MPGLAARATRLAKPFALTALRRRFGLVAAVLRPPSRASRLSNFNMYRDDDDDLTPDAEAPDLSFEARTDDGRRLTNMLASICLSSRQRDASSTLAWCEVTDHGMTFTVGVAKSMQAIAYVKREGVFHAWWLADEHRGDHPSERLEFGINLATLLECLRIFGGASVGGAGGAPDSKAQLHMNFKPATACLNLSLVEGCARALQSTARLHSLTRSLLFARAQPLGHRVRDPHARH